MSYKQTVLGQYVSYLTTETRNTYVVQQHRTMAISKSSFRTLLPKLTWQSSRDIILTEQHKAEKFEDAKSVNRRTDIKISAHDAFLE